MAYARDVFLPQHRIDVQRQTLPYSLGMALRPDVLHIVALGLCHLLKGATRTRRFSSRFLSSMGSFPACYLLPTPVALLSGFFRLT
mgnify:CR=1 FL=1